MAKESMELLKALNDAMDTIEKIVEDGQVTLLDLRYMPELVRELKPGIDGVSKIQSELEDATPDELRELSEMAIVLALKLLQKFK